MGQIKLWTKAQAELLIKYYSPILIGKSIAVKPCKIVGLDFERYENGIRVVCVSSEETGFKFIQDLNSYTDEKGIISPEEVLKNIKDDNFEDNFLV